MATPTRRTSRCYRPATVSGEYRRRTTYRARTRTATRRWRFRSVAAAAVTSARKTSWNSAKGWVYQNERCGGCCLSSPHEWISRCLTSDRSRSTEASWLGSAGLSPTDVAVWARPARQAIAADTESELVHRGQTVLVASVTAIVTMAAVPAQP